MPLPTEPSCQPSHTVFNKGESNKPETLQKFMTDSGKGEGEEGPWRNELVFVLRSG